MQGTQPTVSKAAVVQVCVEPSISSLSKKQYNLNHLNAQSFCQNVCMLAEGMAASQVCCAPVALLIDLQCFRARLTLDKLFLHGGGGG